ncbi:MAG: family oxidoreductase [Flaviaesturariibacter sp.]|nr:family oxidoreductase [Flaviaesturariibacter sp.]
MNLSLKGKTAVIGGSSQGIGRAVADELAKLGATCILLARDEQRLADAVFSLRTAAGQTHSYHSIDFGDAAAVESLIQEIIAQGPVHILINNTAGPAAGPIVDATADQFLDTFQRHLLINHLLTTAVLPGMKSEGYGRIINIISTSVKVPLKNLGVSNTIRGAVASWAKTMANEVGQFGITVNNVLPGATKTSRLEAVLNSTAQKKAQSIEEASAEMMAEIPAKRFGEPEEIAAVAAFLASPAAAYVNGVSIPVDGGRTGSI